MAAILRRIMEIASARTSSGSEDDRSRSTDKESSSSLGALGKQLADVLLMVLKLLGPKDAFRMILVCKSWRSLVSDDRLWIYFLQNQQEPWESIFFPETNLRLGYPIQ